jgi:hypothetical protein
MAPSVRVRGARRRPEGAGTLKELARVADPDALAAATGPRARLGIEVPSSWLGGTLEIAAPRLLSCDRCSGGGCDGCDRSGALRAPDEAEQRVLSLRLPPDIGSGVLVRVAAPFEASSIELLLVAVRIAESPSAGVRRIDMPLALPPQPRPWLGMALIATLLVVVVILVVTLARR